MLRLAGPSPALDCRITWVKREAACRWWKVWQLWQARKPSFGLTREELANLDAELPLDELLHFRLRTAMRHSHLLQSREYAGAIIRLMNTIAVNAHVPLPLNIEAIIKGDPVCLQPRLILCSS